MNDVGLFAMTDEDATALITALLLMQPPAAIDGELLARLTAWRTRRREAHVDGD